MISDSAKMVHMLEMVQAFFDFFMRSESSSILMPSSRCVSTSKKRPVPAAHLSFISKRSTTPCSLSSMTLLSWPPMSIIVRVPGIMCQVPMPCAMISGMFRSARSKDLRPYPVDTRYAMSDSEAPISSRAILRIFSPLTLRSYSVGMWLKTSILSFSSTITHLAVVEPMSTPTKSFISLPSNQIFLFALKHLLRGGELVGHELAVQILSAALGAAIAAGVGQGKILVEDLDVIDFFNVNLALIALPHD